MTSLMETKFSIALIVASAGRFSNLVYRIPIWSSAGFDQIVIVGKYNKTESKELMQLCSKYDVLYIEETKSWMDTRSKARNQGAKSADTEWILFADDDDAILAELDKSLLQKSAKGNDWLVGKTGEIIVLHRREAFLKFGGYPEDMVSAEDIIMSNRARRFGKGGYEGIVCKKVMPAPPTESTTNLSTKIKNNFWYGFTFLILFLKIPYPKSVLISEMNKIYLSFRLAIKGDLNNVLFMFLRIIGIFLSIFYVLYILSKFGLSALKRETYVSWQGLR